MQYHHAELANGLKIEAESNPSARSVAIGFWVRTGARDETDELNGVTHFLEHMIFKGSERRDAAQVNRDFDAIGSHPNAFTTEEVTVFHAAVLPDYLPQAIEILTDILRPSLRVEDFEMEKQVILEEIAMYNDQPVYSAYEAAKRAFFGDHPLGRSVLGTPESIQPLTRDQMWRYFQERYVPSNITAVVAGNLDFDALRGWIEERCGGWSGGRVERVRPPLRPRDGFTTCPSATVAQEHCFAIAAGPPPELETRYSAEVLATVVGDDTGSRLYWALLDPGLAEAASMDYHEYDGVGAYYLYASGSPDRFQEILETTYATLGDLQKGGITEEELHQAKSKLSSRVVRNSERPMGRMHAIGYNRTYFDSYCTVDDELAAIDAVTVESVRQLLDQYPIHRPTVVALGPVEEVRPPQL